jgi:hypothetical protein
MKSQKQSKAYSLFTQRIPEYRKNPNLFFKEVTCFDPDEWQYNVALDVASSSKVSVKSGHGVGKTALESNIILWFLSCYPYARVVATAPTMQQLHDVLWSEVDKWRSRSPLLKQLLTWTKTYIYVKGMEKRWFAVTKTASKPENMQGFHEDNMLFVCDEASGIEDEIMEAVLATLSGENNKLLMCANPTRTSGTFYDSHTKDRAIYKCYTISSLDSTRTNKENINSFIRKYGRDSNVVKVRVFGEFPVQEDDVFISLSSVEHACNRELPMDNIQRISIGVDVARYGDDETIIVDNVGGACSISVARRGQDLMKTVGDIVLEYRKLVNLYPLYKGKIFAVIDDTGLGGGVTDRLREVKSEQRLSRLEIVPVNFGSKIPEEESVYYADMSTYLWATVRDMLDEDLLSLKDDEELIAQLSVRKYTVSSNGKIQIESKKEMKKRGIGSPERADALSLSCYKVNIFDVTSLL